MVAGGYSRDSYHGEEPRDVDIIVYRWMKSDPVHIAHVYKGMLKPITILDAGYDHERIKDVISVTNNIDFIFWGYDSWEECLSNFDVTLNQYITLNPGKLNQLHYYVGGKEGVLDFVRPGIVLTLKRMRRLEELALKYNWTLSNEWIKTKTIAESSPAALRG